MSKVQFLKTEAGEIAILPRKEYERLTVAAALSRSTVAAREALAHNPLVPEPETAARLIDDLSPLW